MPAPAACVLLPLLPSGNVIWSSSASQISPVVSFTNTARMMLPQRATATCWPVLLLYTCGEAAAHARGSCLVKQTLWVWHCCSCCCWVGRRRCVAFLLAAGAVAAAVVAARGDLSAAGHKRPSCWQCCSKGTRCGVRCRRCWRAEQAAHLLWLADAVSCHPCAQV